MVNKNYLLLSIIKDLNPMPSFSFILWSDSLEILKVTEVINKKIVSGHYFLMDNLSVTLENDEITSAEIEEKNDELIESFFSYLEENKLPRELPTYPVLLSLINVRVSFLPFLNDTPYFPKKEMQKLSNINDNLLICTVLMKSRLHYKPSCSFYFQAIVETESDLCKIDFWGSAAKLHSSIELSSQIGIIKDKKIKKISKPELLYNSFYEEMYFNLDCYKVSDPKKVFMINDEFYFDKNGLTKLGDWIKKDDKEECEIELYEGDKDKENNSEESEYKLRIKRIKRDIKLPTTCINNTVTGTITYLSTLKKLRTSWKDYNIKSLKEQRNLKTFEYFLMRINDKPLILFNTSQEEFYKLKTGKQILVENLRSYQRGKLNIYMSSIYTHIRFYGEEVGEFINNGIGFIPDEFNSLEESLETKEELINNELVTILPLFKPIEAYLNINLETLVINETRKYLFKEVNIKKNNELSKYNFTKGKNEESENMDCYILEKDGVERQVFNVNNYFINNKKNISEGVFDVIVDCIRISEKDVLMCISEVFKC
ncbi:hypothetical protein H312_01590 [Anncaliia algerae PRA339]|uniref:Uncharacterized protein n=1 Tax=Anncaliia algerae PRA339 TaxID=1288291 RepID=A0A059F1E5_9MICR|nr:hypothetical protein H312_01590 [Anncaliia algerae PRA339]